MHLSVWWLILVLLYLTTIISAEDYYQLLGIAKDANVREIRKAFKKLAVTLHPDKNQDDSNAHEKFIKITRAYEVLKDDELRKKYDLHGEDDVTNSRAKPKYHSYTYYRDNFGIYDEDPEIITLSRSDFEQSVLNSKSQWFINFYSPMCSHCHELAPEWRALAREMKWTIRIGAVNCEDEWQLCHSQNIRSYPSLYLYPAKEKYDGPRTREQLSDFVLKRLKGNVVVVNPTEWPEIVRSQEYSGMSWLLFLCGGRQIHDCISSDTRLKLGSIFDGLLGVGSVDCDGSEEWCKKLSPSGANVIFWQRLGGADSEFGQNYDIDTSDAHEIALRVFDLLPSPTDLDAEDFEELHSQLSLESENSWLVYFYIGKAEEQAIELKKLPALLINMRVGRVHCGKNAGLCSKFNIHRYPQFVVLKPGGNYEVYHGRDTAYDVANFAHDSSSATNFRTLSPEIFPSILESNEGGKSAWFVDFYAPWCPPCLLLLPILRKASKQFDTNVNFGSIDCTVHAELCRRYNVRSYPTTVFYNHTETHHFRGSHTLSDIVEFIEDVTSQVVEKLNEKTFYNKLGNKHSDELWMVDFYAPWCEACRQLNPHWRKLAKMVSDLSNVHIGEVDCVSEAQLCSNQGIRSYPTIRLYPLGSPGLRTVAIYSNYQRDAASLRSWLFSFLPSAVIELTGDTLEKQVLNSDIPWLIDFYAPWCGHCHMFAPEFQMLAQKLEGRVKCGKVNCDAYRDMCQRALVRAYPSVFLYMPHSRQLDQNQEIHSQSGDQILTYVERILKNIRHDEL